MSNIDNFTGITEIELRAKGGKKWSTYPDAIGAFVAEMDFGTAPAVTEALESAVAEGILGYLPPETLEAMSSACSTWLQTAYGWNVSATNIRPLADVLTGLVMAIEHFSTPRSAVILPTPGHMPFLEIPRSLGREIIQVPMLRDGEGWKLDIDGLDAAMEAGGGLLIFCNPHNPIGKVYSREEMLEVASIVDKHNIRVYSDEIYAPVIFPGEKHVPYASISDSAANHTITFTSATKAWNISGLKCAQVILSNVNDRRKWAEVSFMAEHGAGHLGTVANTAAYGAGGPWLDHVINYLQDNRELMATLVAEHLPGVNYYPPEGTYFAWLDCRNLGLGDHPSDFFLEYAKVVCSDGALFGDNGIGHLRFNLAMPRPLLRTAIERMGKAFNQRGLCSVPRHIGTGARSRGI